MPERFSHIVAVLGIAFILSGCASWSTFPPIPGAAQVGGASSEPVPSIMATAIRHAHERHAGGAIHGEEIVFNLPEGVSAEAYDFVLRRLGEDVRARPMTADDDRAIHITSVRVRAFDSEVDVVYPRPDGMHEMIMLTLRQDVLNRHKVTGSRLWRIHVAAPQANYVAPKPWGATDAMAAQKPSAKPEAAKAEGEVASDDVVMPEAQAGVTSEDHVDE